jgi:hypothetical protein
MEFVYEFTVRGGGGVPQGRDNIMDHASSCEEVANGETERHGDNMDRGPQLEERGNDRVAGVKYVWLVKSKPSLIATEFYLQSNASAIQL